MLIPISWLYEAADITDSTKDFAKKMTEAGNAVDGVSSIGEEINGVVVGKIAALERHPDADKLWVTKTDIGNKVLQIVTGADNLKVGDYIPVAVHGANLSNGLKIKNSKMRGVESNGMLVSLPELGLTTADFPHATEDGILVFENLDTSKYPLGSDAKQALHMNEEIIDFDVLSNRPDTNCVIGMAREVAAVYDKPFVEPTIVVKESPDIKPPYNVTVNITDSNLCRRFIVRIVENVKIAPSPEWMRRRLLACGVRPINNIVDITNYVMLEYGQPLHAFDINAVAKQGEDIIITIRTSYDGETFTTLDGINRSLPPNTLLVTDSQKAIGIAGVMGGENSMITDDTKTILFESANFNPANIRLTARHLGLRTEASSRFEKGLDPNQSIKSMNRAMELIELFNCGDVTTLIVDEYPNVYEAHAVEFDSSKINELLGLNLSDDKINAFLSRVGITVEGRTALVPAYRKDVTIETDLTEEVARFYGLNNIPSRYTQLVDGLAALPGAGLTVERRKLLQLKRAVIGLGYNEAVTFPFESVKIFDKLNLPQDHADCTNAIRIDNPLNEEFGIMRASSAIGSLLGCLSRNFNAGNKEVRLFEPLFVYVPKAQPLSEMPIERQKLVLACYGAEMDYLSFKGDIEALLSSVTDMQQVYVANEAIPYMHPGRTADINVKSGHAPNSPLLPLGIMGEVHPAVCKNFEIGTKVYVAVIDVESIHKLSKIPKTKISEPYNFPPLDRDLAFVVKSDVTAFELESAIRQKGGSLLKDVSLFDVYQGAQIKEGYKSMAYSLRFRDRNGTLTAEDAKKSIDSIIKNLEEKYEAEMR